jgi:hypothetical protein
MKRLPVFALFVLILGGSGALARQTQLGVDVVAIGLLPMGSYKDGTGPALGGLVGLESEAFPGFGLTIRGGYIEHMPRADFTRQLIPVLGGFKLTSYSSSLYAAAEAGRVSIRDIYSGDDDLVENSKKTKTAWGVGFGSAADQLDLRLSLHVWDASHAKQTMTVALSLGILIFGD